MAIKTRIKLNLKLIFLITIVLISYHLDIIIFIAFISYYFVIIGLFINIQIVLR